ncbi:MAG: ABC transporter ATP-binding protein [Christensenellales bacterium]|jgi:ATP-binding cassette subfamily B multidrug efflux pump
MQKITRNFRGHYKEIILGPLFKLLEAVLELFVPLVMAGIIDIGIGRGDSRYIITRGLLLLVIGILGMASALICQYYAAIVAGRFGRDLRKQSYSHVMSLSAADTSAFGAGGLITRLTNDINQIQTGVNMAIRLGVRVPYLAIGGIIMAIRLNLRIGLIFLAATIFIALFLYMIMKRTLPSYGSIQEKQDGLSKLSAENLAGVRVIRAFSRQKDEAQGYEAAAKDMTALIIRVGKISTALNPLTSVVAGFAIMLIVWLGSRYVFEGTMLSGEIIALVTYMNQTLLALIVAANLLVIFTRALASAKRVAQVLDTQPSILADDSAEKAKSDPSQPALSFKDVTFAYYEGADSALKDVSFDIMPGQTVGLIGGTGSGKTTIVNLIMRYFDVKNGAILSYGVNIKEIDPGVLRSKVGLVPQSAMAFSGSIRRNMQLSAPEAGDDDIWYALEAAQAAGFVKNMAGGLDSQIEEGAKNISGGQRQRLTIARALLRKPELLILDDSSSALDYATDAALRAAIANEKKQNPAMTVLIISQRAAGLRNADNILVMDEGRLCGQGSHEHLLKTNNVYKEICQSQGITNGNGKEASA